MLISTLQQVLIVKMSYFVAGHKALENFACVSFLSVSLLQCLSKLNEGVACESVLAVLLVCSK